MKHINKIILLAIVILLGACTKDKNAYTLSGKLENCNECSLYLMEMESSGVKSLDTIRTDKKGNFKVTEQLLEESIFILQGRNDYIMLCPKQDENITITADYENLATTYTIKGSGESSKLKVLGDEQTKTRFALKMLSEQLAQANIYNMDSVRKEITNIFINIREQQKQFIINYINSNKGSLTTLVALYRNFENRPLIDYNKDFDIYKQVLEGLQKTYPNNKNTKNLQRFITDLEQIKQNDTINNGKE